MNMSWSSYLSQIPRLSAQEFSEIKGDGKDRGPLRIYGKDLDVPEEWYDELSRIIPPELYYMGANDLMAKLPPDARATNMMIYVGHEGT